MSEKAKRKNDELGDAENSKFAAFLKLYILIPPSLTALLALWGLIMGFLLLQSFIFFQFDVLLSGLLLPFIGILGLFLSGLITWGIYSSIVKLVNFMDKLFIKDKRKRN